MAKSSNGKVIPLGTMIRGGEKTLRSLERFIPTGIESVEIFFWDTIPERINLSWMEGVAEKCSQAGITLSSLGLYANPLRDRKSGIKAGEDWQTLIDFADHFQIPVVSGFTGRVPEAAVEASYQPVRDFFSPLVETCLSKGINLAFENCSMEGDWERGDWNIAFLPEIWEVLFKEIFPCESVGLEFDPAHCVRLGLPSLELVDEWMPRIHHIHGKDATQAAPHGFCFPGEGITDWQTLFHLITDAAYPGTVDLEGYHGKFISHAQEIERQKKSLSYLKTCSKA